MDKDTESRDFALDGDTNGAGSNSTSSPQSPNAQQNNYQRLVLPDPAAFRYLEEDPSTTVLERRRKLTGYELYFIEQWGCSRMHPTFVIVTHTGQEQHSITVGVLSIPTKESAWSPRLRVYLKAIAKYHARKKETPLGTLMVVNLSGFPSALTVIHIPDGDLRVHREEFVTNENLKRMGCSGRAGLVAAPPTAATQTKFVQTYKTSDEIAIYGAVIELVKLCQVALMLFGKLAPEYADGLLCDVTETALNEWWSDIGSDIFNVDPSDGILGPTTVSAVLGLLMGARKRLSVYGAPVSKDVFDIANTKKAISYFQRSRKLERTRRLDKQTLCELHRVTAKAASGEGWTVPRAVKSTVAELSGKGGDIISGREKAAIAEIETLDIETFIRLGSGDRFKWLWHGKPRKNNDAATFGSIVGEDGWVFDGDESAGYHWSNKKKDSPTDVMPVKHNISDYFYHNHAPSSHTSMDHMDKDHLHRKAVLKNVTGRVRGVVGRKAGKDDSLASPADAGTPKPEEMSTSRDLKAMKPFEVGPDPTQSMRSRRGSSAAASESSSRVPSNAEAVLLDKGKTSGNTSQQDSGEYVDTSVRNRKPNEPRPDYLQLLSRASGITSRGRQNEDTEQVENRNQLMGDSMAIKKMQRFDWASSQVPTLHHTRSFASLLLSDSRPSAAWERRWPRSLSFTAMVDVMAAAQPGPLACEDYESAAKNPKTALVLEKSLATQSRIMEQRLERLKSRELPWMEAKMAQIEAYDQQCGRDQTKLDMVTRQRTEEKQALQEASDELLAQERIALDNANKDIETLGAKLEYELSVLQSKVEDVEDGLEEFERQVTFVEDRVREQLQDGRPRHAEAKGWLSWLSWG